MRRDSRHRSEREGCTRLSTDSRRDVPSGDCGAVLETEGSGGGVRLGDVEILTGSSQLLGVCVCKNLGIRITMQGQGYDMS